jgi:hypothetical protein
MTSTGTLLGDDRTAAKRRRSFELTGERRACRVKERTEA